MPVTRTMARERPSLFSPPPSNNYQQQQNNNEDGYASQTSPYSLSNEDMNQLTDELLLDNEQDNLTTSGRTYEELVSSQQKKKCESSMMSDETEDSYADDGGNNNNNKYGGGRQSVGFMLGRNSLSNWSTIGGGGLLAAEDETTDGTDIPRSVQLEHQMNTGRKSNISRRSSLGGGGGGRNSLGGQSLNLDTPAATYANVSQRVNSRATTSNSAGQARLAASRGGGQSNNGTGGGRRSQNQLNISHISSSSSSGLLNESDDTNGMLGDSWSPIRTSLENSFVKKSVAKANATNNKIGTLGGSGHSNTNNNNGMVKSPTRRNKSKSPIRSPVRSPLGDISPNRSPTRLGLSPTKKMKGTSTSPQRRASAATTTNTKTTTTTKSLQKKKALSPNGTYSLKEAEGKRLSLPVTTTMGNSASSSSSNMSVSSGQSGSTSSSKTLLTQSASKTMKLALPSLGSSRKQFSSSQKQQSQAANNSYSSMNRVKNGQTATATTTTTTQEEISDFYQQTMLLSPKNKLSTKENARSPAPTPNSQRRVIKRFRASVPSANYLLPDDIAMEENANTRNNQAARVRQQSSSKAMTTSMEAEKAAPQQVQRQKQQQSEESSYENTFEFPSSESIPLPRTKTLSFFHDQAVSLGSPSHQYQLNRAGTNLLSLQEVILPSIAYETNAVLKDQQAKAQRYAQDGRPDSEGTEVIQAIETCRRVVTKCTGEAMKIAGKSWRNRETARQQLRVERVAKEEEEQKLHDQQAKNDRKEARARSRHERYERQKREKKRNHPRNKELWQEVTKLMVDIQKLEKEERLWKEALVEVNTMEEHYRPPEKMDLEPISDGDVNNELVKAVKDSALESTTSTLVEDVTMATERINWVLKSVSIAMEESDKLRMEAYEKYQYDGHKFYGYPKVDDSKGLFMALSMESPLAK